MTRTSPESSLTSRSPAYSPWTCRPAVVLHPARAISNVIGPHGAYGRLFSGKLYARTDELLASGPAERRPFHGRAVLEASRRGQRHQYTVTRRIGRALGFVERHDGDHGRVECGVWS